MIFNGIIGTWECIATFICLTIIPLLLTLPTFSSELFGTASLLQILYISLICIIIFLFIFKMYKKFENKDFIDISDYIGGKKLRYIVSILIILYLFFESFISLSEFTINVQNTLFHETPKEYISLLFTLTVFVGSMVGIRGIFRVGAIIGPLLLFAFTLLFLALFKNVELTNFTPFLGNSIEDFFIKGSFHTACFESIALIFLLGPSIKNIKKVFVPTLTLIMFMIFITYFLVFGIISYPSITDNYAPIYELTKLISYGRFIQRVESIYILSWLPATFIYLSCGISFIFGILKKVFNITDQKRIIPVLCICMLSASLMLSSYVELITFRRFFATYVTPIIIIVLPLLLILFANIKIKLKGES